MNAIQEVKDENIRKIAQTLRSSGLASSETEAIRMAMAMSKTSKKVTQNFDERNRFNTGASKLNVAELANESAPSQSAAYSAAPKVASFIVAAATSTPVTSAPAKRVEVQEEFIFGETASKEDIFSVKNEFEEVVSQDIIGMKVAPTATLAQVVAPVCVASVATPAPTASPRPVAKGVYIQEPVKTPWHPPRPVTGVSKQTMMAVPKAEPLNLTPQKFNFSEPATPVRSASVVSSVASTLASSTSSNTQVSATQSSQNAFSILLGSAQKNAAYEEEVRKHAPQQTTTQQADTTTQQTVAQPQAPAVSTTESAQVPSFQDGKTLGALPFSSTQTVSHPVAQPAVAPQVKKPLMESTVDLSKMFNFNK